MRILHLLSGGGIGGIEILCRDIAELSQEQNEFCFFYSGGTIAEEMNQKNIPVYFFYKNNLIGRMQKLFRLVKRERYDVIIVHHEGMGIYVFYLMLLHCFKKIKYVKYLHCSFEKKYFYQGNKVKDKINYFILKKTLMESNCMVAVSEFVKQSYCKEFACSKDKVKVIYNGIRCQRNVSKADKIQIKGMPVRLLYIGRLIEVKGVHILLRAMKKLIDQGENVELNILGDGPMRSEYERLSKELKIEEKVHFQGYVMDKQMFYENATIFIYPSVWQEAFGISIVEALAQGMICVASDAGGIPEIIDDGSDGFLFHNGDSADLAEVLLKAINCSKGPAYGEMREKAIQKSQQFDIYKMINDLQKICEGLVRE